LASQIYAKSKVSKSKREEATHEHGLRPTQCGGLLSFQDEGGSGRRPNRVWPGPLSPSRRWDQAPGGSPGPGIAWRGGRPGDGVPRFEAPGGSRPRSRSSSAAGLGFAGGPSSNGPGQTHGYGVGPASSGEGAATARPGRSGPCLGCLTAMTGPRRLARHFMPPHSGRRPAGVQGFGQSDLRWPGLTKSLEAERVHAPTGDPRTPPRTSPGVCALGLPLGQRLSDYGSDLQSHYSTARTRSRSSATCACADARGRHGPLAQCLKTSPSWESGGTDATQNSRKWPGEVIGRAREGAGRTHSSGKSCGATARIVARSPVTLRRGCFFLSFVFFVLVTYRPEAPIYGGSKLGPWFELPKSGARLLCFCLFCSFGSLWEGRHSGSPNWRETDRGKVVRSVGSCA